MSDFRTQIPNESRVLIDTNVLLNACFIEDSIARRAIQSLQYYGKVVYCDEISRLEAIRRLNKAGRSLQLPYDPIAAFEEFLPLLGIIILPPGDAIVPVGIHRHDRHIPRAALGFRTWVMTDDLELQFALLNAGISAMNSFDVMMTLSGPQKLFSGPSLPARVPRLNYVPPKSYVIAWAAPVDWPEAPPSGNRVIADLLNFGTLLYDTKTKQWRAELKFLASPISFSYELTSDLPTAIGFGYDSSLVPAKIFMAAGGPSQKTEYHLVRTSSRIPTLALAGGGLGNRQGREQWNGYIRSFSVGDRFISRRFWKLITSVQDTAPHPELDVLDKALLTIANLSRFGLLPARVLEF